MDRLKPFKFARAVAIAMASCALAQGTMASPLWQNDWNHTSTPVVSSGFSFYGPTAPIAYSSDGDVLFAGVNPSPFNAQVTRLDSAGNLRWVANLDNLGSQLYDQANALIANDDGSAFVALGDEQVSSIARVAPSGDLAWMREVPALWMAKLPGGRLVARDCTNISALDESSGDVLWEQRTTRNANCDFGGVLVDSTGNSYVSFSLAGQLHIAKYEIDGHLNLRNNRWCGNERPGRRPARHRRSEPVHSRRSRTCGHFANRTAAWPGPSSPGTTIRPFPPRIHLRSWFSSETTRSVAWLQTPAWRGGRSH